MEKKKILCFFYNRLNDPLLRSNIMLYISELAKRNEYDISIITYEDEKHSLNVNELKETQNYLNALNIKWLPLKWHKGSNLFLKIIDFFAGFFKVAKLTRSKGYSHVISLGSIAGSFIYLYSRILKFKYYLYQYEPHSEYALDNGLWKRSSLQYKLLNKYERKSAYASSVVSSGTSYMQKRLTEWKIKAAFFKVTSVANDSVFTFSEIKRNEIRREHNISLDSNLLIYPGKLGELYINAAEILSVFKTIKKNHKNFYFLIITPNIKEVELSLQNENDEIKKSVIILSPLPHYKMPFYLSAADIGLVAVAPGPSKKFISNIKVGEYLCSGLPYIICKGISEDDIVAEKNNVGIVISDFSNGEIDRTSSQLEDLLKEPKSKLAERCRKIGIEYRGFNNQFKEFEKAVSTLLND